MSEIKRRRLEEIPVDCCSGRMVGEFVPFYFCPRSVMLFVIHKEIIRISTIGAAKILSCTW